MPLWNQCGPRALLHDVTAQIGPDGRRKNRMLAKARGERRQGQTEWPKSLIALILSDFAVRRDALLELLDDLGRIVGAARDKVVPLALCRLVHNELFLCVREN